MAGTVTVLAPLSLRIDAVISLGGAGVDLAPAAFGLTLAFAVGVWLRWLGATKEVAHLDAALLTSEHILQASHRPGLLRGPLVYPQPPRMPSER